MKEPIKPWPPSGYQYEATTEAHYIYKYSEDLDPEGVLEHDEDEERDPSFSAKHPSKINLQWLLDKLPEGKSPKDIKIAFGYDYNCMAFEDHHIGFYYEVKVPAKKAELKAAKEKYKQDLKQYELDLAAYKTYCKEKEIKEAEEKLARLKDEVGEKI